MIYLCIQMATLVSFFLLIFWSKHVKTYAWNITAEHTSVLLFSHSSPGTHFGNVDGNLWYIPWGTGNIRDMPHLSTINPGHAKKKKKNKPGSRLSRQTSGYLHLWHPWVCTPNPNLFASFSSILPITQKPFSSTPHLRTAHI